MFGIELRAGQLIAVVLAASGIFLAGCSTGAVVNGWRLSIDYERKLSTEKDAKAEVDKQKHALELKIVEQNASIEKMSVARDAAQRAQSQAEKKLSTTLAANARRGGKVDSLPAKNCRQMLESLKGV